MGASLGTAGHSDYWYTFVLGTFELAIYPILIACEAWAAVGGWIALKTIAQWADWTKERAIFNLFLIGNVIVLVVADLVLVPMVTAH